MPRVRLFHWKANEATRLLDALQAAGHTVDYDERFGPRIFAAIRQSPPDAVVLDLSRLPSHGREVAVFLRGQKATRGLPMVFVDGDAAKVAAIRQLLPDAAYTTAPRLRSALRDALRNPPATPVVPAQMMDRYRSRTAAQKLGIRENSTVALIDPPRNFAGVIGALPPGAAFDEGGVLSPVTLWFVRDVDDCREALPRMRKIAARTKLWIVWQKGGAVTQPFLRASAAAVGLVDYKICAVNDTWSAMLFTRKGCF